MTRRQYRLPGLALGLVLLASGPAQAQGLVTFDDDTAPVEISADEGIEWRSKDMVYIASGNARAARGDLELFGDQLAAFYREGADGGTEIYRVEAHGNVRIVSPNESVFGDDGYYDVDRGVLMLTGEALRLVSGEDTITARESLEYWQEERMAVARGEAVATRGDKRLQAEILVGHFAPDDTGELALTKVDAEGDVQVATPTEFVRSNSGIYYVEKELAELAGDVKITKGNNQLNGEYAEVNLATGVSRLLAAPPDGESDDRVRGLLVPETAAPSSDGS